MARKVLLLAVVILLGLAAAAQEFPRGELAFTYAYTRFGPSANYAPHMNINGGGGSVTINANQYFGIEAEVTGGGASKANWVIPGGVIQGIPTGANVVSSGNMFTYLFGPRIRIPSPKVTPYFNFLFGGAHTSAFNDAWTAICAGQTCTASAAPSGNSFAMAIGGGLDVPVSKNVAIKLGQFDYLMTRFNNQITGANNQHNFRYQAGIVFRFGNK